MVLLLLLVGVSGSFSVSMISFSGGLLTLLPSSAGSDSLATGSGLSAASTCLSASQPSGPPTSSFLNVKNDIGYMDPLVIKNASSSVVVLYLSVFCPGGLGG